MQPEVIKFNPSYTREDGLMVINKEDVPFPEKLDLTEDSIVVFPPNAKGGNHKHPRTEVFVGFGELILYWLDENGEKQSMHMSGESSSLLLFVIPPFLAHAVVNESESEQAVLYEWADAKQHDVQSVDII